MATATADSDTFQFDYDTEKAEVGDIFAVALQEKVGTTAQNFTWEIQYSLDGGATYTAYADGDGTTRFTGDGSKELRVSARTNRVKIIAIGGATAVSVIIGAATGAPSRATHPR